MGKETTDRGLCCECVHYIHGQLETPCVKGEKKVGYLKQGCWRWQAEESEENQVPLKGCRVCGKLLPITEFYAYPYSRDGRRYECKNCMKKEKQHKTDKKNDTQD